MVNSLKEVAVIGLGNTLRRDDGIGIHILALLQDKVKSEDIALLNFGIASYGLVNYINDFRKVLLIDAIDADLQPATLRIFNLKEANYKTKEKEAVSTHQLSLTDLKTLYKTLGIRSDVQIAGIQVKDTSYGLDMTNELEAAKARIAEEIKKFIDNWKHI
ncbi:MAG TPA: hydrogenase maturation protease [Candidatus Omnitrophota bacterium]|nr:hydrogenase maturation protease [Candidatus Omnitrophota bacterium]